MIIQGWACGENCITVQIRAMIDSWFQNQLTLNDPFVMVSPFSYFPQLFFWTLTLFHESLNLFLLHSLYTCTGLYFSGKTSLPGIDFPTLTLRLQSCPLWHQSFPLLQPEEMRGISFFSWAIPLYWTPTFCLPSVPSSVQDIKITFLETSSSIVVHMVNIHLTPTPAPEVDMWPVGDQSKHQSPWPPILGQKGCITEICTNQSQSRDSWAGGGGVLAETLGYNLFILLRLWALWTI